MHTTRFPVVVGIADKQPMVLKYAIAEAGRLGRSLRVVHCWSLPIVAPEVFFGPETLEAMRANSESVLDGARAVVAETSPDLDVEYVVVTGAPGSALVDESKHAAALIVGSDDVPWFERLLGGAVSRFVARMAACPVVFVPERNLPHAGAGGVVITIDGDTSAAGPLRYAFEAADARREPLHVLHRAPETTLRADFQNHCANLAEVMAGWQVLFPDVTVVRSTTEADPAEACIVATSEASLVVFGRHHGHSTPFARARPIAMTVLRKAQCPVVVVPLDYGHT